MEGCSSPRAIASLISLCDRDEKFSSVPKMPLSQEDDILPTAVMNTKGEGNVKLVGT